jgi:hypothetical protein
LLAVERASMGVAVESDAVIIEPAGTACSGYRRVKKKARPAALWLTRIVRVLYQIFVKVCQKRKCDPLWVKDRLVYGAKCR